MAEVSWKSGFDNYSEIMQQSKSRVRKTKLIFLKKIKILYIYKKMPFNYYAMESNAKDEEKRYNLLTYNLPYTDKSINKAFDEYFERKPNEKMYGYPFIEIEVLKNNNGEYLLYDPDESRFVKDTIAGIPDAVGWPH